MDPKYYSCQVPPKTPPVLTFFAAADHDEKNSARRECSEYALAGPECVLVRSPYTDEIVPRYADLSRIDDVMRIIGRSRRELRYVAIDGASSDFDVYIRYRRPAITFATATEGTFNSRTFLLIPERGTDRSRTIQEYIAVSSGYVDFIYCLSDFDAIPLSLTVLREGGAALFLLEGKFDAEECARITVCSHVFRRICLFKPVSTSVNSTACYLVCFDFLGERKANSFLSSALFTWLEATAAHLQAECTSVSKAKYNATFLFTACEMPL